MRVLFNVCTLTFDPPELNDLSAVAAPEADGARAPWPHQGQCGDAHARAMMSTKQIHQNQCLSSPGIGAWPRAHLARSVGDKMQGGVGARASGCAATQGTPAADQARHPLGAARQGARAALVRVASHHMDVAQAASLRT